MGYFTIKQVSSLTQIQPYTLRFWEKEFEGILTPSRTSGGQRRYKKHDISIIETIKNLKDQGMSLGKIKETLSTKKEPPLYDSSEIDLFAEKIGELVKSEIYKFFKSIKENSS